jgi:LacI family transcriptional regulator
MEGLDALGVRIPQDISVVGIDDTALSRRTRPKLTTVATPTGAAGRAAVDMLLSHGDDRRTTAQVTLQTELVIRDSTGPGPHSLADPGNAATAAPEMVASYAKE